MKVKFYTASLLVSLFSIAICSAQPPSKGISEIEDALKAKQYDRAEAILKQALQLYHKQPDSLVNYIFYTGKVYLNKTSDAEGITKVEQLVDHIKQITSQPSTLRQAYIEAGEFYGSIGKNSKGFQASQQAFIYTQQMPVKTPSHFGLVLNNMATYAQRMGDLSLSQQYRRQALQVLQSDPKADKEALYIAISGLAGSMYYASKTDSAKLYYNKALQTLATLPKTADNLYYRPAVIQNNLAGIYQGEGNTTQAIDAMKSTIRNLKQFLETKEPSIKKTTAVTFQFEATDNLAGIYKELGDLKKAKDLLEYSYQQKKKNLAPDDPGIFISEILLGQLYYAIKDVDKALLFLNKGLQRIATSDGDYLFWQADACNTLALLYDARKNIPEARHYYEKADSLYYESLQGDYDVIYLEFLRNAAKFYAENGQYKLGLAKAEKSYQYVLKNEGLESLAAFYELLNYADIYYLSGNYQQALNYSDKALAVVNKKIETSSTLLDSVRTGLKKPKAILLEVKARYQLLPKKDAVSLTLLLNQLNEALDVLDKRKTVITDPNDISLLMADHSELLEFVKKLTLDLYNLSGNKKYIDELISLNESGIYNRIRARLDKDDALRFAHIPAATQALERKLKSAISDALKGEGSHNKKMQEYLAANEKWSAFLEQLRQQYPRYYQMRYASIFKTLGDVQANTPPNTTLIRYFFIGKDLVAMLSDKNQEKLYKLNSENLNQNISALLQNGMNEASTSSILFRLYQQLWAPFANDVRYKNIVVIPDGILFSLNFEILTPQKINSFRDIASKGLISKYTFSYHYSLILAEQQQNDLKLKQSFVAFAPGFSDDLKVNYKAAVKDSLGLDVSYLSLLPQPFSVGLVNKIKGLLGGKTYLNELSTENNFRINAANYRIIHIGTHAEYNNQHPEYTRLIFAKNTAAADDDNSLFVDEIYNCDLTSGLTVLTACESGRPGYEDGEGMISLSHAFNYAGSQSILTGLWKIDEQASSQLMELFYEQLVKGLPKDEALRQAKLAYLESANGRMLAPQYWAGLVIMGDTSPIQLERNHAPMWWTLAVIALLLAAAILLWQWRKRTQTSNIA